jgi:hypothetical protein
MPAGGILMDAEVCSTRAAPEGGINLFAMTGHI